MSLTHKKSTKGLVFKPKQVSELRLINHKLSKNSNNATSLNRTFATIEFLHSTISECSIFSLAPFYEWVNDKEVCKTGWTGS